MTSITYATDESQITFETDGFIVIISTKRCGKKTFIHKITTEELKQVANYMNQPARVDNLTKGFDYCHLHYFKYNDKKCKEQCENCKPNKDKL